jgi:hypothetical protein
LTKSPRFMGPNVLSGSSCSTSYDSPITYDKRGLFLAACKVEVDAVAANFVLVIVPTLVA